MRSHPARVRSHSIPALALALLFCTYAVIPPAYARDCQSSCGTFTFRPPFVEQYTGTGPYWKVRCVYNAPASGLHNLRTFLYKNNVPATDSVLATVGDQGLEVGADLKNEFLDGKQEIWWNTDLYANDGHFYHIRVRNQPSDIVHDIHTRHGDIGGCGTFGHFLWYVIFDYVDSAPSPTPSLTPTRTFTPTWTPSPIPPSSTPDPVDVDQDGLGDAVESGKAPLPGKSNMYLPDSDGDGLLDGQEDANRNGSLNAGETSTRNRDSDGDGYKDREEILFYAANPLDVNSPGILWSDTDNDDLANTHDPNSGEDDIDNDFFADGYEAVVFGNLTALSNASIKPPLGDVNENNSWDNADSQLTLNFFAGLPSPNLDPGHTDVNRDAFIDNADSQISLNYFARIQQILPLIPANTFTPPTPVPPTSTPPGPTNTPGPSATPTPAGNTVWINHFEEFVDYTGAMQFGWGVPTLQFPVSNPSFQHNHWGGDWLPFDFKENANGFSGKCAEIHERASWHGYCLQMKIPYNAGNPVLNIGSPYRVGVWAKVRSNPNTDFAEAALGYRNSTDANPVSATYPSTSRTQSREWVFIYQDFVAGGNDWFYLAVGGASTDHSAYFDSLQIMALQ